MELIIQEEFHLHQVKLFLKEKQENKIYIYGYDGNNVIRQCLSGCELSHKIIPLLSVDLDLFRTLLECFVNEANNRNIRTENENHLKGRLEATEIHLSDMREAFKKLIKV